MRFLVVFAIFLMFLGKVYSDDTDVRKDLTGTSFWFGLPYCDRSSDETLRGSETNSSTELFVTSQYLTKVRLFENSGALIKTFDVMPGTPKVVSFPDMFECKISEEIQNNGIYVESDAPISLTVYIAWKWTGESYQVIPLSSLGAEYFTMNLYQDYCKMHDGLKRYHPAQILIVSPYDSNEVTYTPNWDTEKGVKKGIPQTVTLQKGQTYLIKGKIDTTLNQSWETDLTGTHITSTKPISVISGHTKGTFPRHSATMLGLKSDFMRNMYMDCMLPVSMLSTEYVSVPIAYIGRTYNYATTGDEKGDIIRFVAVQDSTDIYIKNYAGIDSLLIENLMMGQDYKIITSLAPGVYHSTKPILAAQYAKSWWKSPVQPKTDNDINKGEELENPPGCGQGMFFTLLPNDMWTNYSSFNSPKGGIYNFVNIIYRTSQQDSILFDGKPLTENFGADILKIPGSEFSYVSASISPGGHIISSLKSDIVFGSYAYGNLDGYKDGFAYGNFVSGKINKFQYSDTIALSDAINCDTIKGTFKIYDLDNDTSAFGIKSFYSSSFEPKNLEFQINENNKYEIGDKELSFSIVFKKAFPDSLSVQVITLSGNSYFKTYYFMNKIYSNAPDGGEFSGNFAGNVEYYKVLKINNSSNAEAEIKKLYFRNNSKEFYLDSSFYKDFVLQAGEQKEIKVYFKTYDVNLGSLKDTLMAEFECGKIQLYTFKFSGNILDVEDAPAVSSSFSLGSVNPNPVTNISSFGLNLGKDSQVEISIYNYAGELITSIENSFYVAGEYNIQIDLNKLSLPAGRYNCQVQACGETKSLSFVVEK